jgi:aryl sulfotransferase
MTVHRYRSDDEDSGRWEAFTFRPGDIVISTRSKSGTTWMQMICALLVFGTADLPARLVELSPWLDWLGAPVDDVVARLDAQRHRRFVKTHTPLDGVPIDDRATYVVVARHPLDMAVSLYHQGDNLDRPARARPPEHDWLVGWVAADVDPRAQLDSLPGVMLHLSDAWARRHEPNVVLVHYDDLVADLDAEMRRLAAALGIDTIGLEGDWPTLVDAARFGSMRARADVLAPDPGGVLKDRAMFFRRGSSGAGRELLTEREIDRYRERVAGLAPADLVEWLHRDERAPRQSAGV